MNNEMADLRRQLRTARRDAELLRSQLRAAMDTPATEDYPPNTVYTVAGDVLLMPGTGTISSGMDDIERDLGVVMALCPEIDRPWVIRKVEVAAADVLTAEREDQCAEVLAHCTYPTTHAGLHSFDARRCSYTNSGAVRCVLPRDHAGKHYTEDEQHEHLTAGRDDPER